jgi:hypothetical protein
MRSTVYHAYHTLGQIKSMERAQARGERKSRGSALSVPVPDLNEERPLGVSVVEVLARDLERRPVRVEREFDCLIGAGG